MQQAVDWALVVVDHGSRRAAANAVVERLAEGVRARLARESHPPRVVRYAHMELCEPELGVAIDACVREGSRRVVVVPFFLAPGRHARNDIPRLVEMARERHPSVEIRLGEVLGADPLLTELVAQRALVVR